MFKVFLFVLMATIFEASGDAVLRVALGQSTILPRLGFYLAGAALLTFYGTSLNLAPVDFAAATGMYIATLFVVFQIANFLFFRTLPTPAVYVGGTLVVTGGLIVSLWR